MSINSDVQVMRAKLAGAKGVPTLMQLASQGNMSAAIALKEIKDAEDAKAAMQQQAGINNYAPQGSVLSGLAAEIEKQKAPMPTTPAFAEGGRVRNFSEGEVVEDASGYLPGEGVMDRAGRRVESGVDWLDAHTPTIDLSGDNIKKWLRKTALEAPSVGAGRGNVNPENADTQLPSESPDGLALAAALQAQEPLPSESEDGKALAKLLANYKKPGAAPAKSGLAAAVAPAVPAEASVDDREPRPSLQGQTSAKAPSALDAYLAKLEEMSAQGKDLNAQQQKILDDAHAKAQEANKGKGGFWELMANLGAQAGTHNGRRALNSLGAAARVTQNDEKLRKAAGDKEDIAYQNSSLLLKKADLLAAEGNLKGAYDLRQKATEQDRKARLDEATIRMHNATADATPKIADARVAGALRPRGTGAKGAMTPKDWMNHEMAVRRQIEARAKTDMTIDPAQIEDMVATRLAEDRSKYGGTTATIPRNAQPGATTGAKFLGFE